MSAASAERYGIQFGTVVNAVEDLGMDPNGNEPIDDALQQTMDDEDTLVEFPPGTYFLKNDHAEGSLNNWGIRGLGDKPSDVRFVSESGASQFLIRTGGGNGILVENLTIDYGDDKEGSLGLLLKANDNLRVQDVEFAGFNPTSGNGAVDNLSPQIIDEGGTAIVDGLVRTGPTDITSHGHLGNDSNDGCVWLGEKHVGELIIRNSHIENTGTNAIYARRCTGDVKVENCLFKNNNQTSLRIGGSGCYVKGCDFVVDATETPDENGGELINPHGIIWETGPRGDKGGYIENCNFVYRNAPSKTAAAVWVDGSAGGMAIRNSRFELGADDIAAVRIDDPTDPRLGDTGARPWGVELDGVSVTGSSSGSNPAIQVDNRNGSVVRNSCLQLTGNRDGIALRNSDNSTVEDTNVNVSGQATIFGDSQVSTSNITSGDSCPAPSLSGEPTSSSDSSQTDSTDSGSTDSTDSTDSGSTDSTDSTDSVDSTDTDDSASTDAASTDSEKTPNTLTVYGTGTQTYYDFSATGAITGQSDNEPWDNIESGTVDAKIRSDGATDTYNFAGGLGSFGFDRGFAEVEVNGKRIDTETLTTSDDHPNTLQVVPNGESANYRVKVSGDIVDHPALGTSLSKYDSLDGGELEGWVTNNVDAVQFSGDVTDFEFVEGSATLYYNGEPVDPDALVAAGDEPSTHTLTVHGPSEDIGRVDYRITFDGSAEAVEASSNEVGDGVLEGSVWSGYVDSFEVEGTLGTAEKLTEGGTITVDGEEVDPETLGAASGDADETDDSGLPNTITVDGRNTKGVTGYTIAVSGELKKDTSTNDADAGESVDALEDRISSGNRVVGVVDEGVDIYRFSGDITTSDINGNASVNFDDN
ncbi:hypothetical protein HSB1_32440 [Halogranum salarium B-1]|uniref:Right handed beta helix domain-containing protein n=1 Tax=Halogranum salarium B-1 TaxID=1210908 RepID=J3EU53_9EURY|nr:hypothetical protein HSB1_32440 [Halogranum salarium B-1]